MRKIAPIVAALSLSVCIGLSAPPRNSASQNSSGASFTALRIPGQDGSGAADVNDSDDFFQNAIRSRGPKRDYSQRIEALLKQMTVEEKVGQMTQLTLEMIVSGHDQSVQIDQTKLQKAIGKYGVGSILNCYDQALTPNKWQDLITQIQAAAYA